MHRDNAGNWHRSDEAYLAHVGSNSRTFTDLLAALLWITDNGQVALSGAPVLVTMPQMQEA
jgi:hypothetical protein